MTEQARPVASLFPEHPETVHGDVSRRFVDLVLRVHPDEDYGSAETAMLCRTAYNLGLDEGRHGREADNESRSPLVRADTASYLDKRPGRPGRPGRPVRARWIDQWVFCTGFGIAAGVAAAYGSAEYALAFVALTGFMAWAIDRNHAGSIPHQDAASQGYMP